MRRVLVILIIGVFGFLLLSCGGGGASGPDSSPVMFGLVNSTNWRSANPRAVLTETSLKVYGTSANGQTIILNINSGEVGEFVVSEFNGNYAEFIPNMSAGATRYSTSNSENGQGLIRISSIDEESRTVSGSFSFKAYRASDNTFKTVTDGNFSNVPYQFYSVTDTSSFQSIFVFRESDYNWTTETITAERNDTAILIIGECSRTEAWQSVTLWMSPTISAGVHYITPSGPVYAKFQQGFYEYPAVNGSITIISNNTTEKKIKGTFFFNYLDNDSQTQSITDGQFEVLYEDLTEDIQ
ncbi:MAG: DUF6252 family protein [Bacteroidales bacterium]|nr:DUF6252 family protein [Bacteroidales bacterium]